MNNSNIRLFSIFLILLFCLSPLVAVDLGQGDNSSQIKNNGTGFKDLNDTAIAVDDADQDKDMGIKRDNDVEIQSASVNDSNSNNNLQASDPKISMEVFDCDYGETPIVKIYIRHKNFAYDLDAEIHVQGKDYHKVYKQALKGGNSGNVITLDKNMPPGTYMVTYSFVPSEPDYFIPVTVGETLTINKLDSAIKCSVGDVTYGEVPVIKTTCAEHLENKEAYITSPQFSKEYKFDPTKANEIAIDEDLIPGKYTFNVVYPGDSIHKSQNTTMTFNIVKINPKLTVKAEDITKGGDLHVEVHANNKVNGNVTCKVMPAIPSDSSLSSKYELTSGDFIHRYPSQTVYLVDGVGNATLDCRDLSPGKYMICSGYNGDDYIGDALVFTKFQVK